MKSYDLNSRRMASLIKQERFIEAEKLAFLDLTNSPSLNRERQHLLAQIKMAQGLFAHALISLESTKRIYGSHVLLQIDIAKCYEKLGLYSEKRETLLELRDEYIKSKEVISFETLLITSYELAMFFIEDYHRDVALLILNEALEKFRKAGLEEFTLICSNNIRNILNKYENQTKLNNLKTLRIPNHLKINHRIAGFRPAVSENSSAKLGKILRPRFAFR